MNRARKLGTFKVPIATHLYMQGVGMHPKCSPRVSVKVQRNVPCTCGCGKKVKNCNKLTR